MADINCAWCREPWDVSGLRHEGWEYLTEAAGALPDKVTAALETAYGDGTDAQKARRALSTWVYRAVLKGRGCPSADCGFAHTGDGPHRDEQLRALVLDGVTDDDPAAFL